MAQKYIFRRRRNDRRHWMLAVGAAVGAALVLSGCGSYEPPYEKRVPHIDTARIRSDTVVWQHSVAFPPASAVLTDEGRNELDAFIGRSGVRTGESVTLSGGGLAGKARREAVAARLQAYGLAVTTLPGAAEAPISITVRRRSYLPLACEGEPVTGLPNASLAPPPGCANAANLVRMVANPRDLEAGRSTDLYDGHLGAEAIERYRDDKVKPLLDYNKVGK